MEPALHSRDPGDPAQARLDDANRRIGEQIIPSHTYRQRAELAAAVSAFVITNHRKRFPEKLRYKSPLEARHDQEIASLLDA